MSLLFSCATSMNFLLEIFRIICVDGSIARIQKRIVTHLRKLLSVSLISLVDFMRFESYHLFLELGEKFVNSSTAFFPNNVRIAPPFCKLWTDILVTISWFGQKWPFLSLDQISDKNGHFRDQPRHKLWDLYPMFAKRLPLLSL